MPNVVGASAAVTAGGDRPVVSISPPRFRAASLRNSDLAFETATSIGLKSGESVSRRRWMSRRTRDALRLKLHDALRLKLRDALRPKLSAPWLDDSHSSYALATATPNAIEYVMPPTSLDQRRRT